MAPPSGLVHQLFPDDAGPPRTTSVAVLLHGYRTQPTVKGKPPDTPRKTMILVNIVSVEFFHSWRVGFVRKLSKYVYRQQGVHLFYTRITTIHSHELYLGQVISCMQDQSIIQSMINQQKTKGSIIRINQSQSSNQSTGLLICMAYYFLLIITYLCVAAMVPFVLSHATRYWPPLTQPDRRHRGRRHYAGRHRKGLQGQNRQKVQQPTLSNI